MHALLISYVLPSERSACFYFLEAIDLHTPLTGCETERERTTHALMHVALTAIRTAYHLNNPGDEHRDRERLKGGMEELRAGVREVEGMEESILGLSRYSSD